MRKSTAAISAVAVAVIGIVAALAAASASANYNIASATGGTISGSQVELITTATNVGTIKCTIVNFTASQATETAETLTVKPSYSGCTLAGLKVTYSYNKCHDLLTKPTTTDEKNPPETTHAIVHIKCPTEGTSAFILIKDTSGLGCEVKFGEQETKGSIMMTNEAAGSVLIGWEVTGMAYSWTASCPNAGGKAGSSTNGVMTGSDRVEGKNSGGTKVAVKVT